MKKQIGIFVLVIAFLANATLTAKVSAEDNDQKAFSGIPVNFIEGNPYSKYYDEKSSVKLAEKTYDISNENITETKNANILEEHLGKDKVVAFDTGGWAEYTFNIDEGAYYLEIIYSATEDNKNDINVGALINGEYPFDDIQNVKLNRVWRDKEKIYQDKKGNDVLPAQEEISKWESEKLIDKQGLFMEPYKLVFSGGENKIKIISDQPNLYIAGIRLVGQQNMTSYEDYLKTVPQTDAVKSQTFEAERLYLKSDSAIHATIDRTDPNTTPNDPVKLRYNAMGQRSFAFVGQWAEWEIDVEKSGFYALSFRARQDVQRGIDSHRAIYVDGEILFDDMADIVFPYSAGYYYKTVGDKAPKGIYLSEGKHYIRMQVIPSDISESLRQVDDIVGRLNVMYRKVLMFVGPSPDIFTDYQIDKQDPALIEEMKILSAELKAQKKWLDENFSANISSSAEIEQMYVMLDSMVKNTQDIPYRLSYFQQNISSLSAWVSAMSWQPLEVDSFTISPLNTVPTKASAGFLKNIFFTIRSIIGSFFEDYSTMSSDESGESIKVWISLGRDQAQIVKQMIDTHFTPKSNINVDLSLVQGSILEAVMAGKGPDVVLFSGDALPMNLAARGALEELSDKENFDSIKNRFMPESMIPYEYEGGVYGLPLTQSFPVMFYRKDVLASLGIENLPDTWEEFYQMIPIIQRSNLVVGMGDNSVAKANAVQSPNFGYVFPSLIFQNQGNFYNLDKTATNFDQEIALKAFEGWTELYTKYGMPYDYDLFNRFRTGEMPIAIAPYTTYNQIAFAAPDIKGLWGMAKLPGMVDENGTIHREVTAAGSSGALIFKSANDSDKCFEFIDWFTSDDMQAEYGNNIEILMGSAARYDTANINALGRLPWSVDEYKLLQEVRADVKEIPVIPSTYFVNREISNAFRKTIMSLKEPRETLILYNRSINKEISRKISEID